MVYRIVNKYKTVDGEQSWWVFSVCYVVLDASNEEAAHTCRLYM